jgi:archaemetzincin
MSKRPFLGLVALGPIDPEILRRLRSAIHKTLFLPVRVLRPKPVPPQAYHVVRHQYHSTQLLEYILAEDNSEAFRVMGVTAVDLYIPIFTFVFGEAQLDGKAAVISLLRPRGDVDGSMPPRAVVLKRLIKLSLHELGHTFALGHCRQDRCLMGFSANLEILDQKAVAFCEYCQVLLTDYFRDHGVIHRIKRYGAIVAPGAPIPIPGSDRKRRR